MQTAVQFQTQPSVSPFSLVDADSSSAANMVGVSAAWRKLIADPERITSIGMRDWAHVGQLL